MKITKTKGFTLMEMMVALGIFAILTAVVTSQFIIFARNNALQSAARELAGDIQLVKQRAKADSTAYTLQFTSNTTYTYQFINVNTGIAEPPVVKNVTTVVPNYTDITFAQNFPGGLVNCTSRGTISWGTVTLTNSRGSTVSIAVAPTWRLNVVYTPK